MLKPADLKIIIEIENTLRNHIDKSGVSDPTEHYFEMIHFFLYASIKQLNLGEKDTKIIIQNSYSSLISSLLSSEEPIVPLELEWYPESDTLH